MHRLRPYLVRARCLACRKASRPAGVHPRGRNEAERLPRGVLPSHYPAPIVKGVQIIIFQEHPYLGTSPGAAPHWVSMCIQTEGK